MWLLYEFRPVLVVDSRMDWNDNDMMVDVLCNSDSKFKISQEICEWVSNVVSDQTVQFEVWEKDVSMGDHLEPVGSVGINNPNVSLTDQPTTVIEVTSKFKQLKISQPETQVTIIFKISEKAWARH